MHTVPTFDPNIKDQTAIVTGANGISGFYTRSSGLSSVLENTDNRVQYVPY